MARAKVQSQDCFQKRGLGDVVTVRYFDHVLYHRGDPALMKPQIRECLGWLVYKCEDYITMAWDRNAEPPTLRGGDPKASGLVILRSDILEMKHLG
jgi:hypothetical protein